MGAPRASRTQVRDISRMSSQVLGVVVLVVVVLLVLVLLNGLKIVQEYERGVIFRLGRCIGAKGPGLFFIIPLFDKYVKVSLQMNAVQIPVQQVISSDSVSLKVDAFAYMQVVDPVLAVNKVTNWYAAAQSVAQTSLQTVIGHHQLDELLTSRDRIAEQLRASLDDQTEAWGVKVERVELRDIDLPEQIQRAMGRQAEAERERRAKVVAAEGELQASQMLAQAAATIHASPGAMHLRTLQTLAEIAQENHSTILFPVELIEGIAGRASKLTQSDG
ncbi:MAG: mechanosensory protein 2 [Frankiales bacterium]|nr:mechanosensory protein 2 [Frankiales bacterium]